MTRDEGHDGQRAEAVDVFAAFLDEGRAGSLDELCEEHPDLAGELRRLAANFRKLEGVLGSGDDADAGRRTVRLDEPSTSVIERLAGRSRAIERYAPSRDAAGRDGRGGPAEPTEPTEPTEIGRGGMGAVLRVWDVDVGRQLAMKVALGSARASGGDLTDVEARRVRRFLDEVQITGQLDHPGVVPVHELGLDDQGRLYFTMRLVEGRDLGTIFALARDGREGWNRARALSAVLRVCETMAFAHERGVIHRDLKPANVMVGGFGETYVMDWGLAKVAGSTAGEAAEPGASRVHTAASDGDSDLLTQDGAVLGTPAYMSPEQARGELAAMGPRSDVYSVGAMLYHLLAGRAPYVAAEGTRTAHEVHRALLAGPPAPLHVVAPDVPAELAAVCERAMARDPVERYADMGEMAEDLRAYLEGRVVRAYETGAVAEFRKWVRRNKGMAASIAAAIVLALGGLASTSIVEARANRELEAKNVELARAEESARRSAQVATTEAARANENAQLAKARREESERERERVLRLSDLERVAELRARADQLFPARPSIVPDLEVWLAEARDLAARLPLHRETLASLRERALPSDRIGDRDRIDGWAFRDELDEARRELESHRAVLTEGGWLGDLDAPAIEARIADLERSIRAMEAEAETWTPWRFGSVQIQWEHDLLAGLVEQLETLVGEGGLATRVDRRLWFAQTIEERSVTGEDAARRWAEALASIADEDDCPMYGGLSIRPQVGLLPVGRDPASGLWEFVDLGTGDDVERGLDGRLAIDEGTGVVLVLLPGGDAVMGAVPPGPDHPLGAPHVDPAALINEAPVHAVRLDPFLMSKYELTQGQFERFTGENPSVLRPGFDWNQGITLRHPVEGVSWNEAKLVLGRMGFELPTEAQWEYAARGGTTTPWWTGDVKESIDGAGNINDVNTISVLDQPDLNQIEDWLDDGYGVHAPVGSFAPNPFGMHDVIGNVSEFCADGTGFYHMPAEPGTGLRFEADLPFRIFRGSSWSEGATFSRSATRFQGTVNQKSETMGVRPARPLDGAS